MPNLGISNKLRQRLTISDILTAATLYTCLWDIVNIFPSRVESVRMITTIPNGKINAIASRYSVVYRNWIKLALNEVNRRNKELPTINR
jgi:hypothetical protein